MMRRVAEIAIRRGLACQVAVERAMACGMGTCQSCVIRVKSAGGPTGSPRDGVNRLACTDGPVFAADTLLW
jgi:dihydroorotate dehydrogenase electron transfer subunit